MHSRGLFIISLFFLGGLIMGSEIRKYSWGIFLPIVFVLISFIGLLFYFSKWRRIGWIWLLVFFSSFFYYCWFDAQNKSQLPVGQVSFIGIVKGAPNFDGDVIRLTVEVTSVNHDFISPENIAVHIYLKNEEELKKGREIIKSGRELLGTMELKIPDPPSNPGQFNYQNYLYWKKIHRQGTILSFSTLSYKKEMQWNVFSFLDNLQSHLSQKMDQLYNQQTSGLLKGFLLGNSRELDEDISLIFSHLGLSHILAISGQHITWLMAGLFLFFRLIGVYKERAQVMVMFILPLYVFMTGASPSALRALIMGELVLISLYFRLFRDGLNILSFAFLFMVVLNPYYIHDIGFQLSFAVTAGLILLVPKFTEFLPIKQEGTKLLAAVTFVATIVSFPFIIYHFHIFSLASPITNFVIVPLFEFVIAPLSFLSLLLGLLTPQAGWILSWVVETTVNNVTIVLKWVDNLDFLRIVLPSPPRIWLFGYIFGLLLFFLLIYSKVRSRRERWAILSGIVIILTLPLIIQHQADTKTVRITFLDVGQGDSIVVETSGIVTVIDSGGPSIFGNKEEWQKRHNSFNPSKNVLIPYLYYRGINKIDALILTHWDHDHVGGVPYLLQHFPVGRVIVNGEIKNTNLYRDIQQIINQKQLSLEIAYVGESWVNERGVHWRVVSPEKGYKAENDNDSSLVLLLEAYTHRVLFTGDLEENGETKILQGDSFWPIDILKIGHHGSNSSTSEKWIQTLRPYLSIISVGKNNRYGHPNLEVIHRILKNRGGIERTDQSGAITILIDEKKILYQRYCNNTKIP